VAKSPEERLDGQKRAILDLRGRVGALEKEGKELRQALADIHKMLAGGTPTLHIPESVVVTGPVLPVTEGVDMVGVVPASTGGLRLPVLTLDLVRGEKAKQWVPSPLCLACGNYKEPGRDINLTCKACGIIRHKQVMGEDVGDAGKYQVCGHCGFQKPKPGLDPVCGRCKYLFSQWKKNQS
jgi:hypothetical protein